MILPTAEQVLSNLPFAFTAWTALSLSWGVYILASYYSMMKDADVNHGGRRKIDVYNSWFIMCGIAVLITSLLFGSQLVNFSDALVVINVFFNVYLVSASITVLHWWKANNTPPSP